MCQEDPQFVERRTKFINDFIQNKSLYYRVIEENEAFSNNCTILQQQLDQIKLKWKIPIKTEQGPRRILVSHDESTLKSGEMTIKSWRFGLNSPFYSKGRGRSILVSDFIIQHPTCPFFELSDFEWQNATQMYPELLLDEYLYLPKTATRFIELNGSNYFDNDTILEQFVLFSSL